MSEFFHMISTLIWAGMIFAVASITALSLPKSRLRTVLSEFLGYGMVAFCAFYAVSPVDIVPEAAFGPLGYIDDLGAVYGGYLAWQSAMKARRERQLEFSDN